jgi:hypothetical protein
MGQSMQDDLPSIEAAAEGLWHSKNGFDHLGFKSHLVWQDLSAAEKQPWREEAAVTIRSWKRSNGYF